MPTPKKPGVEITTSRNYYSLIRELAITDFKLKYQGSVFGYLWSLMKPLAVFGVLYLVFTVFVRIGSDVPHYPLYLLLGIVLWNYFSESTTSAMRSIVDKGDLIRKVYFPRIVILIANSISALITLVLNLVVIVVFMAIAHIAPTWLSLTFILLIAELYILSLGVSFFLAALYVRFRDFAYIWDVLLQLGFYASGVIYPLSIVPSKYLDIILLNPITQILQDSRYVLISKDTVTTLGTIESALRLVPYVIPIVLVITGYFYFEKWSSRFAEDI
jgi:ABC-2 type transport system permease protein